MEHNPVIIDVNHLTKKYTNDIIALKDVNVQVHKGITALIGPNGSGKSTFIKILLGLLKPSHGSVKVFSYDSWERSIEIRKKVGIIHENHYFPQFMTIRQYLHHVRGFYDTHDAVDLGNALNLPENRKINTLSAGMYRKLGLLQAFLGHPELLIMDEPTANLDPLARTELIEIIRHIHKEFKVSFLISSHILSDLEQIATNVVTLNNGEVTFTGTYRNFIKTFRSKTFELHVTNPEDWSKFLEQLPIIKTITKFNDIIYIDTTTELTSGQLFEAFMESHRFRGLDFDLFRRSLDLDKVFTSIAKITPDTDT